MTNIQTILHPTDFSETAEHAFKLACSVARDHQARLIVLHVIPPPLTHAEAVARAAPDSYRDQLWRELEQMKQRDITVGIEPMLEDGLPAKQIVQTAKDEGCSLIVMGTHGRTGLSRLLMGSVAEHVLRHATCPVLTVRMPLSKLAPEESAPTWEKAKV